MGLVDARAMPVTHASERPRIAVIINPISGTGGRPEAARRRAELALETIDARGFDGEVFVTERQGHARELARTAVARGAGTVVAWGGDGTVNEVAGPLADVSAALAIVPSGSGNGLARHLQIPFDPVAALDVALAGAERRMDAGELDGHLFVNVAGVGLDARVAHRFAGNGLVRRGFSRYLEATLIELMTYVPDEHTIVADGTTVRSRSLLVAIANARQYGNGAIIAPDALIDDGKLDLVIIAARSWPRVLWQVPRLFRGHIARVPGVTMLAARHIELAADRSILYHVDGEPHVGGPTLTVRVRPRALRVRVPGFAAR